MTVWLVVLAAGLGSYVFRISMILLVDRIGTPTWLEQASAFVVPVAFVALATGGVVASASGVGLAHAVPPLAAVAAAVAAVRRTGSSSAAIVAGMPTLWLLTALLST
jgi:branched-subunit amino acid transport protein